ncbi:MAG: sulfite exporter TauE/SafE family protein [Alphaproteobacteria bacterium]|jgi:hypothetical protein
MTLTFALFAGALGLVIGVLVGTTGIGGVLLVPALVFLWGFDVHVAVATAMAAFMLGGVAAALLYGRRGSIDWRAAGWLCAGAMPAAFAGTYAMAAVPAQVLELGIAAFIIAAGGNALRQRKAGGDAADRPALAPVVLVAIGVFTGVVSALSGTAGPITLLPILMWLRLPVLAAVGLAQAIQFPITLLASIGNIVEGRVDTAVAAVVAVTIVAGVVVGTRIAHGISTATLARLVAGVLVATGVLMAVRVVYGWALS